MLFKHPITTTHSAPVRITLVTKEPIVGVLIFSFNSTSIPSTPGVRIAFFFEKRYGEPPFLQIDTCSEKAIPREGVASALGCVKVTVDVENLSFGETESHKMEAVPYRSQVPAVPVSTYTIGLWIDR